MENKEYIVLMHNLDAGANALLGEFGSNDSYDISENIKAELIKANKVIDSYKIDEIKSTAVVGAYSFNFITYIQLGEGNKKRISLFLKEKCKLGQEDKELTTFLKSVIVDSAANVIEIVKKEFNMYIRDESTGIDMTNSSLQEIITRKNKVVNRAKFLKTELNDANKAYVLKMLSLIKTSGPYGNQLLLEFRNIVKNQKLLKSQDNYWANLKKIIDKLVIDNALLFNDKTLQRMKNLQEIFMQTVANVKEPANDKSSKPQKKGGGGAKKKGGEKKKGGGKPKSSPAKDNGSKPNFNVLNTTINSKPLQNNNKTSNTTKQHQQPSNPKFEFTGVTSKIFKHKFMSKTSQSKKTLDDGRSI